MRKRRIGKAKSRAYAEAAIRPARSRRVYLRMNPADMAYLKFILEGYDNLAYLSTVDRYSAVAQFVYTKGQEREALTFLEDMRKELGFTIIKSCTGE
ncbi:hypothetical protein JCM16814_25890 [Desulfobaculum senezii]